MLHDRNRDRVTSRSVEQAGRARHASAGGDPQTSGNVRAAAVAMAVAFMLFAVFASEGMRHFTRDLPANDFTDILVNGADRWHELMLTLGPAHVGPAIRGAFLWLHGWKW